MSITHLGLTTRFLLLSDSCGSVDVGRSLWRENGSAVYNCFCSSPAQLFLGPSPAGLVTIFYCLGIETPWTWRARFLYLYPPGTGWPSYTPRHWIPFRRLLRLAGPRWRYSNPPSHLWLRVFKSKSHCDWRSVSQPHLGLMTIYLLLFDGHGLVFVPLFYERTGLSFVRVIVCSNKPLAIM
jgi:hypothetical protein